MTGGGDRTEVDWSAILDEQRREMVRADERFGGFASSHEAFGVLSEEVDELLDALRANDPVAIRREAIQVAAVAIRMAGCCGEPAFRERSGFDRPS